MGDGALTVAGLAIPTSIIGTFIFMNMAVHLNNMTRWRSPLVGLVIDDAIGALGNAGTWTSSKPRPRRP